MARDLVYDKLQMVTLDNGLRVALLPRSSAPVVAVQVWVNAGSAMETPEEAGMAHLIEHMLFKGSTGYPKGDMAAVVEGAGGDINAWTSLENTVYHITMSSAFAKTAVQILSDAVQNPLFDAEELQQETLVVLEEIKRGKDDPAHSADETLFAMAFKNHPWGRPVIGFEKVIKGFTRHNVVDFHGRWYRPKNAIVVVTGDFKPATMKKWITDTFGTWKNRRGPVDAAPGAVESNQRSPRVKVLRDATHEARLHLAFPTEGMEAPYMAALDVLGVILAQGDSSRLTINVERRLGLITDETAGPYAGKGVGAFLVEASLVQQKEEQAVRAVFEEVLRIAHGGVGMAELAGAKQIIESEVVFHYETAQGTAARMGNSISVTGAAGFEQTHLARVQALKPADVQEAARRILNPAALSAVLLLPQEAAPKMDAKALKAIVGDTVKAMAAGPRRRMKDRGHGIVEAHLRNGARVFVREIHDHPVVAVRAGVLAGTRMETPENNGINNLISHLLTMGTKTLTGEEIARQLDALGVNINGFSGYNTLGIKGAFRADTLREGLELITDCLFNATFPQQELQREKEFVLENIRTVEDSPARVAFELMRKELFGNYPYGMTTDGTLDSVSHISRSDLVEYAQRFLSPDRLTVTVVGDVNAEAVVDMLDFLMGEVPAFPSKIKQPAPPKKLTKNRKGIKELPKRQSHIVLGYPAPAFSNPQRHAAEVLNAVLGSQGGRLFVNIRDTHGLAYSIGSVLVEGLEQGFWAMYIGTGPENQDQALQLMRAEVEKVLAKPPTAAELRRAKRFLRGSTDVGLQSCGTQSMTMLLDALYLDEPGAAFDRGAHIDAVTAQQVMEAAKAFLAAPHVTAIVQPVDKDNGKKGTPTAQR